MPQPTEAHAQVPVTAPLGRSVVGFTLIELMVTITIITILAGMLLAGASVVSQSASKARTRGLVDRVLQAVQLYQSEDHRRRFPPAIADRTLRYNPTGTYAAGTTYVVNLLATQGFAVHGEELDNDAGPAAFLADAWGQPLLYQSDEAADGVAHRPLDAHGVEVQVPTDATDLNPRGTQPYAYVWSYGRPKAGSDLHTNASNWLYHREAP